MANDLQSILERVSLYLMDPNHKSWDEDTLYESLCLALADLSQAAGEPLTIQDLDEAVDTKVEPQDLPVLVQGAAAYAAFSRTLDLAEKPALGVEAQTTTRQWAVMTMALYKSSLALITRRTLNKSTQAPHSPMEWTEEPKNF